MRYTARSIFLCSMAFFASAFLFAIPASSATIYDRGDPVMLVFASDRSVTDAIAEFSLVIEKSIAVPEFAEGRDPRDVDDDSTGRLPTDLKPEYEESLATNGQNFIETRLRC